MSYKSSDKVRVLIVDDLMTDEIAEIMKSVLIRYGLTAEFLIAETREGAERIVYDLAEKNISINYALIDQHFPNREGSSYGLEYCNGNFLAYMIRKFFPDTYILGISFEPSSFNGEVDATIDKRKGLESIEGIIKDTLESRLKYGSANA